MSICCLTESYLNDIFPFSYMGDYLAQYKLYPISSEGREASRAEEPEYQFRAAQDEEARLLAENQRVSLRSRHGVYVSLERLVEIRDVDLKDATPSPTPQASYQPRDIQTLDDVFTARRFHQYLDTLGMAEYEFVVGKIIEESQKAGQWIAVGRPLLDKDFSREYEEVILKDMVDAGFLMRDGDRYRLTSETIHRIAKEYPASVRPST